MVRLAAGGIDFTSHFLGDESQFLALSVSASHGFLTAEGAGNDSADVGLLLCVYHRGDAYKNTMINLGADPENPFVIFDDVKEIYAKREEELKAMTCFCCAVSLFRESI